MREFEIPEDVVILTGADEPIIRPPDKTTSLRWNDADGDVHIVRLDQVIQIDVEPVGGDDEGLGYYLLAHFIRGTWAILNEANPEQDHQQAIATAIQIIKLASDAEHSVHSC